MDKPLRGQTRIMEIAGRTFEVPIMYIDGRPKPGKQQDSLLLEVIWPEMRSTRELKDREEYETVWHKERRGGWILIEPASKRAPIQTQIEWLERGLTKKTFVEKIDGLEKYIYYHGKPENPEPWSEMYLEKDSVGTTISYSECHIGRTGTFPRCNSKFIDHGLIYDINYNKAALFSEWRQQRQRTIDFMSNLEIIDTQTHKENE